MPSTALPPASPGEAGILPAYPWGMARVVVVGAGAGGLAVAARLAARRHDVTLLEAGSRTGGMLHTLRRDGFAFDLGPSLFTLPAVYRDLFLKTGKPLEDELDLRPVEPGFRYTFADGSSVDVPGAGPGPAAAAFGAAFGGQAGQDWRDLMARAATMWRLSRGPILGSPLAGWRSVAPLARRPSDIAAMSVWRTLRGLGRASLDDPRLRLILDRYATYSGSDPRLAPAALATIPYVEQTFGIWHLGGGLGTLADALTRRLERLRVDVRLDTPVARIATDGGRVTGVLTADGQRFDADLVVSDVDADTVHSRLLDEPTPRRRRTRSSSAFVLLLALRGRTPDAVHHQVLFPSDYDAEFDALFGRRRRPARPIPDPAIALCNPQDPLMRPEGHEAWTVLVNAPPHGDGSEGTVDWDAPGLAERYAEDLLAILRRRGVDPTGRVLWRRVITPADLQRQTRSPGGSIYGAAGHGRTSALRRPANRSAVPGLYLVGGSAHPGGGLPLVGMSAEIVSDLIGRA